MEDGERKYTREGDSVKDTGIGKRGDDAKRKDINKRSGDSGRGRKRNTERDEAGEIKK